MRHDVIAVTQGWPGAIDMVMLLAGTVMGTGLIAGMLLNLLENHNSRRRKPPLPAPPPRELVSWSSSARTRREDELARRQLMS
ncbi:hypothetical protein ASG87_05360 [Frateuria sp. Soil773]|uniref:hypothetical protein n=1 Tax=Frateuria sp. Soil773 TaxID=1736407 RepID=UPI0006FD16C6|nr:hypothetical protein [Frateuria sp. Soil773]KRE88984.1 hypothetical protein ASG87_05360 [Frateuria sp. Soil773]